jgi:phosphotransferase system HPr-like phosphotransfer protein
MDLTYPQTRWIEAIQMDFAARADWCIKPYKEANHAPKISVKEGNSLKVKAGNKITLTASATDPDGNKVNFTFWQYAEAGTSPEKVTITQERTKAQVQLPGAAKSGDTIHIIIEGKDEGSPALTRYQRVILNIE